MVIDDKTTQINTFSGGMNTDTSDALLDEKLYRFAKNVRYVTDTDSNTGELHLVDGVVKAVSCSLDCEVIKATLCRNLGVIVVKRPSDNAWMVLTYNFDSKNLDTLTTIFGWCKDPLGGHISTVTRYEDEDNQKLYIADGEHGILVIDLIHPYDSDNINEVRSIPAVHFKKPIFGGLIPGNLKAGMVLYSYQYYNKYRQQSEISPATRLIPIIKGNFTDLVKNIQGCEKNTTSDKGVKITIQKSNEGSKFDHIKIYRITYVETGLLPTIECIYDGLNDDKDFTFSDTGSISLSALTLEEYNLMTGLHITPSVLESKNDYLFAAGDSLKVIEKDDAFINYDARAYSYSLNHKTHLYNYNTSTYDTIEDPSEVDLKHDAYNIYTDVNKEYKEVGYNTDNGEGDRFTKDGKYYGGDGINVHWKFVVSEITGDASIIGNNDYRYGRVGSNTAGISINDSTTFSPKNIQVAYIKSDGSLEIKKDKIDASDYFNSEEPNSTYANPAVAYYMKSLRRDEVYRYGIVFYDNKGNISPVKWIADIRTPNMYWKGFNTFVSHGLRVNGSYQDLAVRPLGVEFTVDKLPELKNGHVIGYEIVRCSRSVSDVATISQGVISRPVRAMVNPNTTVGTTFRFDLTPQGYINSNLMYINLYEINEWMKKEGNIKLEDLGLGAFNGEIIDTSKKTHIDSTTIQDDQTLELRYNSNRLHNPNNKTYLFISPEICCTKTSMQELLNKKDTKLVPQLYLFGSNYRTTDNKDVSFDEGKNFGNADYLQLGDNKYYFNNPAESSLIIRPFSNSPYKLTLTKNARSIGLYYRWMWQELVSDTFVDKSTSEDKKEAKDNYGYIKYYESSDAVCVEPQYSNNLHSFAGSVYGQSILYSDNGIRLNNTYNMSYPVIDTAWPEDLKWNSFLKDTSTKDGESNWVVSANEKLTAIGTDNFNNWVFNGYDAVPYAKQTHIWDHAFWSNDGKMEDANQDGTKGLMDGYIGIGGRCLLLNLDINQDSPLLNTICTYNHFEETSRLSDIIPVDAKNLSNSKLKYDYYTDVKLHKNVNIFRNSILGTYLCNLRQTVTPYGGSSNEAKSLNTYTSYGDYFDDTHSHVIFDGDCFIEPFEYVSMHKLYHSKITYLRSACVVNAIPVETNMNLYYLYGYVFSKHPLSNVQVEAGNVDNEWILKNDMYVYNQVYSLNTNVRLLAAYDSDNDDLTRTDYRCYYSNLKENNEAVDNWLKFMSSNFLDADSKYGAITEMVRFKDLLVFWLENSTGIFSINERAVITDQNNTPLILGTGGVLTRYDYISNTNGMKKGEFADAQSDSTLYWWDHERNEICGYSPGNGVVILSKTKLIQNYINNQKEHLDLTDNPLLFYDKKYNELIAKIFNTDGSILYSEFTGQFVSSVDIHPAGVIITSDNLYIVRSDSNIYQWNLKDTYSKSEDSKDLVPYIDIIVNKSPLYTKVYDNGELYGLIRNVDKLHMTFKTPLKQYSELNGSELTDRETNFDYRIPRAFNAKSNAEAVYGDRLRGKTMHIYIDTLKPTTDFSLGWIITKYRISWS